jgi:hypothetical protein
MSRPDHQPAGVTLLNGPVDWPPGARRAAFAGPAGNTWEIAQVFVLGELIRDNPSRPD